MKLNYFKVNHLVKTHRQIEVKDGFVYMRAKKRPMVIVKAA